MSSHFQRAVLAEQATQWLAGFMTDQVLLGMLKKVSRTFYLSLRLLPASMRGGVGLAYLLARASDTIADSWKADLQLRLDSLDNFTSQIEGQLPYQLWPRELIFAIEHVGERELLNKTSQLLEWLRAMPESEIILIREVLRTIISGQRRDLELFGSADEACPIAIGDRLDLDEYTYRVAGCVGEFWTRFGFVTLGDQFSEADEEELSTLGREYGKGLQLTNILRDVPEDLKSGRCYLPVEQAHDRNQILREHQHQRSVAIMAVSKGMDYASHLKGRRLRMASVMPALLAKDTLEMMQEADWGALNQRVKISKRQVYANLIKSMLF